MVTLEEARDHMRIDGTDDDPWLLVWIPAVEAAVLSWLKEPWRAYVESGEVDSDGNPIPAEDDDGKKIVKPQVKAAVLLELAQHYRFRDGKDAPQAPAHWGHGYALGVGATSLLASLRKSTVA